jgi:hypothetical protein
MYAWIGQMKPPEDLLKRAQRLATEQARLEKQEADGERLLAGEDPNTPYREDAVHWAGVYAELVGFKNDLLERLNQDRQLLSDAAKTELERDENLLRMELERLKLRLGFWEMRREELTAE